jgi:hypothetical protein
MKRLPSAELQSDKTKKSNNCNVRDINKEIVKVYYTPEKGSDEKFKCRCGKLRTQKPNTGHSNLVQHVKDSHPDWEKVLEKARNQASLDSFFRPDQKSLQIYGWLDLIISEGYELLYHLKILNLRLPLNTCEKANIRKYVTLEPICQNTLLKYIERLTSAVEAKIAQGLAEKFPLVLDGWTLKGTSTHYVCLLSYTLGNVCFGLQPLF